MSKKESVHTFDAVTTRRFWKCSSAQFKNAQQRILVELAKRDQIYVGQLACLINAPIAQVENVIKYMINEGVVRYYESSELLDMGLDGFAEIISSVNGQ